MTWRMTHKTPSQGSSTTDQVGHWLFNKGREVLPFVDLNVLLTPCCMPRHWWDNITFRISHMGFLSGLTFSSPPWYLRWP